MTVRAGGATITAENPTVPQGAEMAKLQEQSESNERVGAMLDALEQATVNDIDRGRGTTPLDKEIQLTMNKSKLGNLTEVARNSGEEFSYWLGTGSKIPDIIWLSSNLRGLLRGLTAKGAGFRAYKFSQDISTHYPYATDSNQERLDKIAFWRAYQKAADTEARQRGVPVYQEQMTLQPTVGYDPRRTEAARRTATGLSPETGGPTYEAPAEPVGRPGEPGYAPTAAATPPRAILNRPPFNPVARDMSDMEHPRMRDSSGAWWYYDYSTNQWHQMGR
jgi:hypothetical protein